MPKHNPCLNFNGQSLCIEAEADHDIFYYLGEQITGDLAEAEVLIIVGNGVTPSQETAALAAGKMVVRIPETYSFATASQKELNRTDWQMLRRLEALLPEDDELRITRNTLRAAVDDEV